MRTIRIAKKPSKQDWGERRAAPPLLRNDHQCIGAHADYRREDFVFQRTQSLAMRALEWERRLKPIRPWGINVVANLAWDIFA